MTGDNAADQINLPVSVEMPRCVAVSDPPVHFGKSMFAVGFATLSVIVNDVLDRSLVIGAYPT